jgi:hypothetical protein
VVAPVQNWRKVLRHAWSVRLLAISSALTGIETIIPLFYDNPPFERGYFALAAFFTTIAAAVARFVAQKAVSDE